MVDLMKDQPFINYKYSILLCHINFMLHPLLSVRIHIDIHRNDAEFNEPRDVITIKCDMVSV